MSVLAPAIYARIARAKEHLASLKADIDAFCRRNAHEVRHEIDPETAEKIVVYYAREHIPVTWSILIGEIAHNLRSSLDQAVYDLTIRESGHPVEFSEFPFSPIATDSRTLARAAGSTRFGEYPRRHVKQSRGCNRSMCAAAARSR